MRDVRNEDENVKLNLSGKQLPILNILSQFQNSINSLSASEVSDRTIQLLMLATLSENMMEDCPKLQSNLRYLNSTKNLASKEDRITSLRSNLYQPIPVRPCSSPLPQIAYQQLSSPQSSHLQSSLVKNSYDSVVANCQNLGGAQTSARNGKDATWKNLIEPSNSYQPEVIINSIEGEADDATCSNLQLSNCGYNALLTVSKLSCRKSIRKQTSFAKTDVKSNADSCDDLQHSMADNSHLKSFQNDIKLSEEHGVCSEATKHKILYHFDDCDFVKARIDEGEKYDRISGTQRPTKMIGKLTESERKAKIEAYLLKKRKRLGNSTVKYHCRQNLAKERFRFQGRFVRLEDLPMHGKHLIIDFDGKKLLKPIFSIQRVDKRRSKLENLTTVTSSFF